MADYYYLVTGLPELRLGQEGVPMAPLHFVDHLREQLAEEDRPLLDAYLLRFDNENLLALLKGRPQQWSNLGTFTREELEAEMAAPFQAPLYMSEFLDERKRNPGAPVAEDKLHAGYQLYLANMEHPFLVGYAQFDALLRNAMAAINGQIAGDGSVGVLDLDVWSDRMRGSGAADLGLAAQWPFITELSLLLQEGDLPALERKLDALRFAQIDELLAQDPFSAARLVGWLAQLLIVQRWVHIERGEGPALFHQLVQGSLHGQEVFNTHAIEVAP